MHAYPEPLIHISFQLLDVLLDFSTLYKLVKHPRLLILFEKLCVLTLNICKRGVEHLKKLATKARHHSQSAGAEHNQHKGIVRGPLDVVDLKISFASFV